jgi:beta-lactamase regulating signal transducer with metallopeptidase domain
MHLSLLVNTLSSLLKHLPGLRSFAQIAASDAIAALWQGALVAIGLAFCLRFTPRIAAAHRFLIWAVAYVVLVALQVLPFATHFASAVAASAASTIGSSSPRPWLELDVRWSLGLAALWLVLACLRAGDLVLHSFRLRRLWKSATPVEDDRGVELMHRLGHQRVQVCTTAQLERPSVIGFFAPRILIPDWLYAKLTPGELEQVILHEAEHLRRRDDWTNLLQKLCLVLFPLNPALIWMERRLCREREMACDEGVVRVTHAPRAYAACLASLAERRLQRRTTALSLGAFERRPELVHRVHSILLKKNVLGPLGARALLGAVGCGLLFAAVEMASCPQLVAFVPAHRPAMQVAQTDSETDAYLPVREGSRPLPYRATNVEAIVPAARSHRAMLPHAAVSRHMQPSATAKTDLATAQARQQLVKAKLPSQETMPQEWLVLTTWQVQTPAHESGNRADYDAGAESADAASTTASEPSQPSQITVTRLILKVYPGKVYPGTSAAAPQKQTPGAKPDSAAKKLLSQPMALPFDSSWLVIQL